MRSDSQPAHWLGEIFERDVGQASPLKLERSLNATWNEGGLMYAIPFIRFADQDIRQL